MNGTFWRDQRKVQQRQPMTFFVACFATIGFISYRCWFFGRMKPRAPFIKEYEEIEDIAVRLIEVSSQSSREIRDRIDRFHKDFPHPNARERMKRVLK